jgi:hypothetical protein
VICASVRANSALGFLAAVVRRLSALRAASAGPNFLSTASSAEETPVRHDTPPPGRAPPQDTLQFSFASPQPCGQYPVRLWFLSSASPHGWEISPRIGPRNCTGALRPLGYPPAGGRRRRTHTWALRAAGRHLSPLRPRCRTRSYTAPERMVTNGLRKGSISPFVIVVDFALDVERFVARRITRARNP